MVYEGLGEHGKRRYMKGKESMKGEGI